MGGGNGMKSKTARDRKMKDAQKSNKGSQLKSNANSMSIVCQICRTQFMCTSRPAALLQHADSKHAKLKPEQCFPHLQDADASS